ncbi:MAG TPA: NAD-dependent succinate-semialdehyde dehydrogenase [Motilibacteraceae bacterium]|nr:NAD-dependent succinate-semialdehyde dehydrogenase [Motilibacteraceae bacterium]
MTALDTTTSQQLPEATPVLQLVGGEWCGGSEGEFDVLDPSTGELLARVPRAGLDDLDRALAAAERAQPAWAARAPRERGEVLRRAFELMVERREDIARLMSLENGKALSDARGEVGYAAEFFRWFSEEAVRIDGELRRAPSGANRILTSRKPVGIAYLVTPWNFPAAMATRKIAPALAAGCAVVLKPAEDTPLTALYVARLLQEAGVPDGLVNVLTTDRPGPLSEAALADPRVRKLSFTGSTPVGRLLLKQAADRVLNCSMELGGNDPFVVCDDADLDAAVEGAMLAKMRNGGQACTAANRFLVHDLVHDAFAARLAERMGALAVGPGPEESTQLGPMVNAKAVTKMDALVQDAISRGARRVLGEGAQVPEQGCFYPPTVLVDVPADAQILAEEVFGPVAALVRVASDDEAVRLANATEFGLVGYVYTRDLARGLRLSEALDVGMVGLNRGLVSDPAAPFGGVKQSGLGREGGYEGIEEYLETQYVAASW